MSSFPRLAKLPITLHLPLTVMVIKDWNTYQVIRNSYVFFNINIIIPAWKLFYTWMTQHLFYQQLQENWLLETTMSKNVVITVNSYPYNIEGHKWNNVSDCRWYTTEIFHFAVMISNYVNKKISVGKMSEKKLFPWQLKKGILNQ